MTTYIAQDEPLITDEQLREAFKILALEKAVKSDDPSKLAKAMKVSQALLSSILLGWIEVPPRVAEQLGYRRTWRQEDRGYKWQRILPAPASRESDRRRDLELTLKVCYPFILEARNLRQDKTTSDSMLLERLASEIPALLSGYTTGTTASNDSLKQGELH